jgi:hypothetical protein
MGQMTWDLATLQYHRWHSRLTDPAGRPGRLGLGLHGIHPRLERPTRNACLHATEDVVAGTYRVAREVLLPCFQGHPSQAE